MAASIRASTAATATNNPTSPAGTTIGDLVIVFHWTKVDGNGVPTHTLNTGALFEEIATRAHDDGTTDGRLSVACKVCTVGGAQTYNAYTSSAGTDFAGITVLTVGTWERAAGLSEIGDVSAGTTLTTNAQPNPPSIITPQTECLVFTVAAWHLTAAASGTLTAPTGYTNLVEMAGSVASELAWASKVVATATTEDPGTWTDAITPNGTSSITFAIRPRSISLTSDAGAFALTGTATGLTAARTITASTGTFALTGIAATLGRSLTMTAAAAAFALTGNDATLEYVPASGLDADAGAFTLTGTSTGLLAARRLDASTGAFSLTGTSTGLAVARRLTADTGTCALTGQAAGLSRAVTIAAAAGSVAVTGTSTGILAGRLLGAAVGAFSLTGNDAELDAGGPQVLAGTGAFSLDGPAVGLSVARGIVCSAGAFVFAGVAAELEAPSVDVPADIELVLLKEPATGIRLTVEAGTELELEDQSLVVAITRGQRTRIEIETAEPGAAIQIVREPAMLDIGDDAIIIARFRVNTTLTDPTTLEADIFEPGNDTETPDTTITYPDATLTKDAVGIYRLSVDCTASGTWRVKFRSTGTAKGAESTTFTVRADA